MKSLSLLILGVLLGTIFIGTVLAETEPNNSLDNAEIISAGTFEGSVYYDIYAGNDEDFYQISVPAKTEVTVTVKKMGGEYAIYVSSYDEYKSEMGMIDGITMMLDDTGETDTQAFTNDADSEKIFYLGFEGDGEYMCTVELGDAGSDDDAIPHGEADDSSCGSTMVLCVFGILISIVIVAGFIKRRKSV